MDETLMKATLEVDEHHWWYRFKLNGRNHRATTQTAIKRSAIDIEASERRRILEGRHDIRRQRDIAFRGFAGKS